MIDLPWLDLALKGRMFVMNFLEWDVEIPTSQLVKNLGYSILATAAQTCSVLREGTTRAIRSLKAREVRYRAVFIPKFPNAPSGSSR